MGSDWFFVYLWYLLVLVTMKGGQRYLQTLTVRRKLSSPSYLALQYFWAAKRALYSVISLQGSPLALIWIFSSQLNIGDLRILKDHAGPCGIIGGSCRIMQYHTVSCRILMYCTDSWRYICEVVRSTETGKGIQGNKDKIYRRINDYFIYWNMVIRIFGALYIVISHWKYWFIQGRIWEYRGISVKMNRG